MEKSKIRKATVNISSQSGNNYIYDASTNMIFPDISGFSEIVENYYKVDRDEIVSNGESRYNRENMSRNYEYVEALINNFNALYFKNEIAGNPVIETEEDFQKYLANINQIVLEVTQSCNLRCSYCLYSEEYNDYRNHNNKKMDEEIAVKSIDRFFSLISSEKRTRKYKRVFINFYGGEPLLNIDLIKKIVDYIKNKFLNKMEIKDKVQFTISTNGILLKGDIVNFLIENDFLIAISLDGPKDEHDRNRVTTSGEGSFDIIWNNLSKIISSHYKYFRTHFVFLSTLSPNHNLIIVNKFFNESLNDGYGRIKISFLKGGNFSKQENDILALRKEYYDGTAWERDTSPYIDTLFRTLFKKGYNRNFPGRTGRLTSSCFPDEFRFFVSSTGEYHICERINPNFSIGNYKTGIQFDKVKKVFEEYNKEVISRGCSHCAAKNFCSLCFASVSVGSKFHIDTALCEEQIKLMKSILRDIVSICEKNEKNLDNFVNPMRKIKENIFEEAFY